MYNLQKYIWSYYILNSLHLLLCVAASTNDKIKAYLLVWSCSVDSCRSTVNQSEGGRVRLWNGMVMKLNGMVMTLKLSDGMIATLNRFWPQGRTSGLQNHEMSAPHHPWDTTALATLNPIPATQHWAWWCFSVKHPNISIKTLPIYIYRSIYPS